MREGCWTCNKEREAGGLANDIGYPQSKKATTINTAIPMGLTGKCPIGLLHIRDGGIRQQFSSPTYNPYAHSPHTRTHAHTHMYRIRKRGSPRQTTVRLSPDPTRIIDFIIDLASTFDLDRSQVAEYVFTDNRPSLSLTTIIVKGPNNLSKCLTLSVSGRERVTCSRRASRVSPSRISQPANSGVE